jgi:hypothetical protein
MSSEEEKKSLRFLAACEQASAGIRSVAVIVASYFNALVESGLTREEAVSLTAEYQKFLFNQSFRLNDDNDN